MKFSIGHLLLVFPTFLLSLVINGCFTMFPSLVTFKYVRALNDFELIKSQIESAEEYREESISEEEINQWLDGTLPQSAANRTSIGTDPPHDPWGNPYRCIRKVGLDSGEALPMRFYSLGQDQMTSSNGNDPDDVNSWGDSNGQYYFDEYFKRERFDWMVQSTITTPLVYVGLMGALYWFRKAKQREQNRMVRNDQK